jgi:predicted DNA-binding helix-hairpin-helix protein
MRQGTGRALNIKNWALKCDKYLCKYCFISCSIKRKRVTFEPDQLATTFVSLQRQKRVDGLFLSSQTAT